MDYEDALASTGRSALAAGPRVVRQKTYHIRLTGSGLSPQEVVQIWKEEFPSFHPPQSRFYPPLDGVAPGEVMLINASVQGMPVYTGVMVLYADNESFTVMTAEGLPEAVWNTFSAYRDDNGATWAQVQSLARASDPLYEIGFRLFGSTEQERIWAHVLTSLAARFGVNEQVQLEKVCVDTKLRWTRAGNVWHNASARSLLHAVTPWVQQFGELVQLQSRFPASCTVAKVSLA